MYEVPNLWVVIFVVPHIKANDMMYFMWSLVVVRFIFAGMHVVHTMDN